jgi:phosphonate transport system substrate-binding protein
MKNCFTSFFLACLLFVSSASDSFSGPSKTISLKYGINSTDSPVVIAKKILPILKVLEGDLKKRLGQKVEIDFKVFRTYDNSVRAFVKGGVDFGRLGPASYVIAKRQNKNIRLLAMENRKGKKRFNGLIVVRKDSPLDKLSDLQGKNFAFGNKLSTIGRYLAQRELIKSGCLCQKFG